MQSMQTAGKKVAGTQDASSAIRVPNRSAVGLQRFRCRVLLTRSDSKRANGGDRQKETIGTRTMQRTEEGVR